ncbi:MAG TPA: hypothetical protein VK179_05745 [Bacteroidales bacterium]|nr:hypothetical protein [Bacteroidales bacterium]
MMDIELQNKREWNPPTLKSLSVKKTGGSDSAQFGEESQYIDQDPESGF